ncbi:benzoate 4-monooxygenase cytochrome P450 [Apiospora arundinis]
MGLFTEMGHNQKALEHLYQEVKDMDVTNAKKLANEETLRLYPALITGGSRMARQKDMVVAGRWIPPYTTIVAPPYLIARRDDCFVQPHKFVPERWTTAPEMVLNASAFRLFGTGHTSCVCRPLTMDDVFATATVLTIRSSWLSNDIEWVRFLSAVTHRNLTRMSAHNCLHILNPIFLRAPTLHVSTIKTR